MSLGLVAIQPEESKTIGETDRRGRSTSCRRRRRRPTGAPPLPRHPPPPAAAQLPGAGSAAAVPVSPSHPVGVKLHWSGVGYGAGGGGGDLGQQVLIQVPKACHPLRLLYHLCGPRHHQDQRSVSLSSVHCAQPTPLSSSVSHPKNAAPALMPATVLPNFFLKTRCRPTEYRRIK